MIPKDEWLEQAKLLPVNRSRRVVHGCGDGTALLIEHKQDGYRCWCHRCGDGGWEPKHRDLAAMLAAVSLAQEADKYDLPSLPNCEYSHDAWPNEARLFLYRAGMSEREACTLGIGFNHSMQRVILPVRADDRDKSCVYWQGRGFSGDRAKYINPRVDRSRIVAAFGTGGTLVLVEDYLSAWKIGKAGAQAWALLGTSVPDPILTRVLHHPGKLYVWLDPDYAGQSKASKLGRTLQLVGREYMNVVSRADPKLLQLAEIKEILSAPYEPKVSYD